MQKPQIIRLLLIIPKIACFFLPFLTHKRRFLMNNKILGTSKRNSSSFLLNVLLLYLQLKIFNFIRVAQKLSVEFDNAK